MKEASKKPTGRTQSTLDGTFEKKAEVKVFTREAATHAIAQFVACDDQVRPSCCVVVELDTNLTSNRLLLLLINPCSGTVLCL